MEIEVVSIVLFDNMYCDCVEEVVKYKKYILFEKLFVKELEDGKVMYELIKDYDKVFIVGFLFRFDFCFNMIK